MCFIPVQLVMDEVTGLPTEELSDLAKNYLSTIGCKATTVSEIIDDNKRDGVVLKGIQEGIDRANKNAASNAQRVCLLLGNCTVCIVPFLYILFVKSTVFVGFKHNSFRSRNGLSWTQIFQLQGAN